MPRPAGGRSRPRPSRPGTRAARGICHKTRGRAHAGTGLRKCRSRNDDQIYFGRFARHCVPVRFGDPEGPRTECPGYVIEEPHRVAPTRGTTIRLAEPHRASASSVAGSSGRAQKNATHRAVPKGPDSATRRKIRPDAAARSSGERDRFCFFIAARSSFLVIKPSFSA